VVSTYWWSGCVELYTPLNLGESPLNATPAGLFADVILAATEDTGELDA
jgi:hypothetical protein